LLPGNQGNQWLRADLDLDLPAGKQLQLQVVIEAITAGDRKDSQGDIAIDDIIINTEGNCAQNTRELSYHVSQCLSCMTS